MEGEKHHAIAVAFGAALVVAVLLSALARGSVMSLPLLFLVVGALIGNGGLGLVSLDPAGGLVSRVAEITLFAVLFTDGKRALAPGRPLLWRPPARALLVGIPAPAAIVALLAWALADLPQRRRCWSVWCCPRRIRSWWPHWCAARRSHARCGIR